MTVRYGGRDGNRRDENEDEIVRALKRVGASVELISAPGVPDLLVGFRDGTFLIEVKGEKGRLTDAQKRFRERWRGGPVITARTWQEALRAIGAIA